MPILLGIPHAFPTMYRNRWPPSEITDWRLGIWDAFVGHDVAADSSLQSTGANTQRCSSGRRRRGEEQQSECKSLHQN
jgi:hypothetical protein